MENIRNKIITISGEPASGKSTVVKEIKSKYEKQGFNVYIISVGDVFRETVKKEYLKRYPDRINVSLADIQNDKEFMAKLQSIDGLIDDEIARKGIFMSFQLPEEIPGVSVTNFLKYAKNKITGQPVKIFQFKDELKKYMEELNMNPKNMERSLNVGFSGGEKKKNEILQMLVLNPKLAILDETDSGLDVDAIKTVSKGIEMFKNENNAVLIITHNTKILHSLKVDYVHVLVNGKIVKTGGQELASDIEENGYAQYK